MTTSASGWHAGGGNVTTNDAVVIAALEAMPELNADCAQGTAGSVARATDTGAGIGDYKVFACNREALNDVALS